jgi:hypothetical protein
MCLFDYNRVVHPKVVILLYKFWLEPDTSRRMLTTLTITLATSLNIRAKYIDVLILLRFITHSPPTTILPH